MGEGEGVSVGDGSQDSGWGDWAEPQIKIKNTGLGVDTELSLGQPEFEMLVGVGGRRV